MAKKVYIFIVFMFVQIHFYAQCVACKQTVEAQIQNGSMSPDGINKGIVYLMLIPYLLLMIVGYVFYKNYKRFKTAQNAAQSEE